MPSAATTATTMKDVYHALLDPPRIEALTNCDNNLLSYDPYSFLIVFRVRGRHFEMILLPLVGLLIWDLFWGFFLISFEDPLEINSYIQSMEYLITPMLTPVSFLLVFRLGRAAVRYWDARAALGKMVEVCRTIASTALVGCSRSTTPAPTLRRHQQHQQELAENFVRWIAVFPMAVKNFLRPWEGVNCSRQVEIGHLLSPDDKRDFLAHKGTLYAPILVLNRIRQLAHQLAFNSNHNHSHHNTPDNLQRQHDTATTTTTMMMMNGVLFRQLNEQIDVLTGAWGAMERINGTPLPFVYVVHLRTFLLLYLFLWHMEAIASSGWIALIPLQLASWGLLGIEAAAVECERPFQWHSNHLALGKACIVVAKNLAQTMQNLGYKSNNNNDNRTNNTKQSAKIQVKRLGPLIQQPTATSIESKVLDESADNHGIEMSA